MIRQLAGAMALAVASVVATVAPVHAQDQKGTLVFAVESLGAQTLDPILEGRPGNAVYQAIMYDSLVGFDLKKGGVGPGVAERWELAPDGLSWTFFIRPGQTFHNGDKLTAHDVKFSLERQMGPGSLASAAASMKRVIKSIEVVDELTVKVNTATPQIGLPPSLSRAVAPEGAIMPKNYIEKVGEEEFRKKPIGSGPWKFVRNVPGDRIEFTAVANHWRGTPSFKDLHVLLVPEESTRVAMVRTGEAAIASIGPETMMGASRAGLEVLAVPGTMQAIFQFWGAWKPEQKEQPIAKPRVRQALSLAIDRKQVIEHVMNGKARMPYPFSTFSYTEYLSNDRWEKWAAEAYRYDPVLAKKMLAEIQAGLYAEAKARLDGNIKRDILTWDALAGYFGEDEESFKGWVRVAWARPSGAELEAVGAKLKGLKLTIRNAPGDQPEKFGACIFSGKPGVEEILIGRAY